MSEKFWKDLAPDPDMLKALEEAERAGSRAEAVAGERDARHKWSNTFADACARMIARAIRRTNAFSSFTVLPDDAGNSEPPTFIMGSKKKRVDVVVSSNVSGLQVGFSLKGMNFRDASGGQFDKNLTGRTYELQDEVRLVHEYQPAAFFVGVYFLPIAATVDKRGVSSPSSFARTVEHLRARTGRIDPTLASQLSKIDMGAVALYVPGDEELEYRDVLPRGLLRFFDVTSAPPKRGRPKVETTWSLDEFVRAVIERYESGGAEPMEWAEPEDE